MIDLLICSTPPESPGWFATLYGPDFAYRDVVSYYDLKRYGGDSPETADTRFGLHHGLTPFEIDRIRADYF